MFRGSFLRVIFAVCLVLAFNKIFSQSKTIIKDTVIEEIVYEYDTIYIDDIKLNIDTIYNSLKPRFPLLPILVKPELTLAKFLNTPIYPYKDTLMFSVSLGISAYTITNYTSESNTSIKYNLSTGQNIFPSLCFGIGFMKGKMKYGISAEYRQYSEVLKHTIPENWQDTLDNANEIYYRDINGQLSSIVKNQYKFVHLTTSMAYKIGGNYFSVVPTALIGAGFNLEQKNFYLDTLAKKIVEIPKVDKAGTFLSLGIALPIVYSNKKNIDFYIKPEWQHFFIATNSHPLSYRNMFGLSFGVAYSFNAFL